MARIMLGFYMVRYPLGGMLAGYVQWMVGLTRLGHDVYVVEKAGWPKSCYDPSRDVMTDDCSYGVATVRSLLDRYGLAGRLCFVDRAGAYYGCTRRQVERLFDTADLFIDMGTHGAWLEEAQQAGLRVLVDGEPGARQMRMKLDLDAGSILPEYDRYFTVGRNVGTPASSAPTAGKSWSHVFHPVVVDLFRATNGGAGSYTTVMNWRSHDPLVFEGTTYGQKDVEFEKFFELPRLTRAPLEVAVAGRDVPTQRLQEAGWRVRDGHDVTISYDAFLEYIACSRGEFSVAKNVFVETWSGWFSDRSAIYLASGRPAVLQDTGFSEHLPCGEGLLAVRTSDEAAAAIEEIEGDYARHASAARELAYEHLEATKVLAAFLDELGL